MSEIIHTPGEWDWSPASGEDGAILRPARVFVVAGGTSRDIAEVGLDRLAEANANARLLAAAPRLYRLVVCAYYSTTLNEAWRQDAASTLARLLAERGG